MRRTFYMVLSCLFMGYCICFGYTVQNALAAPQVLAKHVTASTSGKQAHDENVEQPGGMKKWLDEVDHPSANRVGNQFQSNVLRNARFSHYRAQSSFTILWLPVKFLDLPSLWKQKRDHTEKTNVDDYGE